MTTLALVGGQYGSEGKGVIAAGLAHGFRGAVRTGGPNAGHSFWHKDALYKMQQVPCAWINLNCMLMLGAGAVIDPHQLRKEMDLTGRLVMVDPQASIILPEHHDDEVHAGMRAAIGSTTEGVGAARIAKIRRDGRAVLARDYDFDDDRVLVSEVYDQLADLREYGGDVMLEGTQGAHLSLHHGRYPFVTSNDTNAAQLAADAGMPPSHVDHTHLVVRTMPIRVAGNSGETGGAEVGWERLIRSGAVEVPEKTTVTKLQRRIFDFSGKDLQRAIDLNDPCGVWVTFGDYIEPELGKTEPSLNDVMTSGMGEWLRTNILPRQVPLLGVGVGGKRWRVVETGAQCFRFDSAHVGQQWPLEVS